MSHVLWKLWLRKSQSQLWNLVTLTKTLFFHKTENSQQQLHAISFKCARPLLKRSNHKLWLSYYFYFSFVISFLCFSSYCLTCIKNISRVDCKYHWIATSYLLSFNCKLGLESASIFDQFYLLVYLVWLISESFNLLELF